ncbi:MAG: hypothetical protein IPL49_18535 [Saprospirales bacterium]|nr:hypothetical protein [Saprospirales bacterium]MBK8492820.1 hypothetical protein [Saprospirales bacterium]
MKRIIFFSLLLFSLSSCMTIGFQVPQPAGKKALDKFPQSILGVYADQPFGRDTGLMVSSHSVFLTGPEDMRGELFLSDTLILKKYKGYYIANYWDNEKRCWIIHPFTQKGNQLVMLNLNFNKEEAVSTFSAFTPIVRQDTDLIVLDPTRKAFKRMLKDPMLWEAHTMYRVRQNR